jgi:hypothetical protein
MEHSEMDKYVNDPSNRDDGADNSCCIKTDAGGDMHTADIDDHGLHCIKTESDSCLGITDVNTPTKTETDNIVFFNNANMGNHALACIKTEDATIADVDEHELHCIKREPAHNDTLSDHTCHCLKTEAENLTDVSEHTFYKLKTENSSNISDVNNQATAEGNKVAFDTKSSVKAELQDYYAVQNSYPLGILQIESTHAESARVVIDCTGIMTTVNTHNHIPLQMGDDYYIERSDVKPNVPSVGVCVKHEHTYCEDDTYPSASTLMAACEGEYGVTDDKQDKSVHCVESFTRLDIPAMHTSA